MVGKQPKMRTSGRGTRFLSSMLSLGALVGIVDAASVRRKPRISNFRKSENARLYMSYTHEVSPHVDWDRLRDEYAIANVQETRRHSRRLHRHRHKSSQAKRLINNAIKAAQRAGPTTTTDGVKSESPSSEDDSPSMLDEALDYLGGIMVQAEAAQRSKAQRQDNITDPFLGLDDDNPVEEPTGAPTGPLNDDAIAPSEVPSLIPTPTVPLNDDAIAPSEVPSVVPTDAITPSEVPSLVPTNSTTPSEVPSLVPTNSTDFDGEVPSEAPSEVPTKSPITEPTSKLPDDDKVTPPDDDEFIGVPIPVYRYNPGTNCQNTGDGVPCAPDDLRDLCDKTSGDGKFSACLEACIPSFCCIHDAPPATNTIAPSCSSDPNCAEYAYCYIVWWKFQDTIGPATQLRLEQNDDFFDLDADFVVGDVTGAEFYQELLLHHFDISQDIIDAGTVVGPTEATFDSDLIFLNPDFWDAESAIPDAPPP